MMPPPSAGPDTSWPTSSPHGLAADTDKSSCRGAVVAVRCGTAPGASLHRSRLLHARWRRAPRQRPHRRGIPPSAAEPARTRACPACPSELPEDAAAWRTLPAAANGTANLFMLFAPLEGWRHVKVTDRHTAVDYAHVLKDLADLHFSNARTIVLLQDNLNTHSKASLYEAFPAVEARRLVER